MKIAYINCDDVDDFLFQICSRRRLQDFLDIYLGGLEGFQPSPGSIESHSVTGCFTDNFVVTCFSSLSISFAFYLFFLACSHPSFDLLALCCIGYGHWQRWGQAAKQEASGKRGS